MKPFLFVAALALCPCLSADASVPPAEIGAAGCRVINFFPVAKESITWDGGCKDGYADGKGTLVWLKEGKETSRYEGTIKQGRYHGQGYSAYLDGVQYEGEYVEGSREGRGIWVTKDGTRYDGGFKAGRFHGKGSIAYSNNTRYDGQFENGLYHGKGRAQYVGGQVFDGEFVRGIAADQMERPPLDAANYLFRPDQGTAAASIKDTTIRGAKSPFDRSYADMTPSQRQEIRNTYPLLHDTDEPPYPLRGRKNLSERISNVSFDAPTSGLLDVRARIDANGNATSFKVIASPDPGLTKFIAFVLMKEQFKPGLCAGKPCAMDFVYQVYFNH